MGTQSLLIYSITANASCWRAYFSTTSLLSRFLSPDFYIEKCLASYLASSRASCYPQLLLH